jgi:nucleotide-binding universal stress UspA family protein
VDDSEESLRAVEWAAGEAERRREPLQILHAFIWPLLGAPLGPAPGAPPEGGLRHDAERILGAALARAHAVAPGIEVTTDLPESAPVAALLHRSHQAGLLVVGSRGLGELGGLLLGSVGAQLGTEAACPVVVVRGPVTEHGPVVVGLPGPPGNQPGGQPGGDVGDHLGGVVGGAPDGHLSERDESEALLAFAFAHAARTTNALVLAHVSPSASASPSARPSPLTSASSSAGRSSSGGPSPSALPESALARWQERFPGVTVTQESLTGRPGKTLMHAASHASLLVVGSHHRHELGALMHGSVSQAALHHATCAVAIVPVHR